MGIRLNEEISGNVVVVVPPFSCAWLQGEGLTLPRPSKGCVVFDAKGDNDVTIIFKREPGSSREQYHDVNYTVIFGSHQNTKVCIDKNGRTCHLSPSASSAAVQSSTFDRYWVDLNGGAITVGKGDPYSFPQHRWEDVNPNNDLLYVGLASWNTQVFYRNIEVKDCLDFRNHQQTQANMERAWHNPAPPLSWFCARPEFADTVFVLNSEPAHPENSVPAHRTVLATSCALFDACVQTSTVTKEIRLDRVERDTLLLFLKLCYSSEPVAIAGSQAESLYGLAQQFGAEGLRQELARAFPGHEAHSSAVLKHVSGSQALSTPRRSGGASLSDVTLRVEDELIPAQRVVLSLASLPFFKLFTCGMRESRAHEVTLHDTTPAAVRGMLSFLNDRHRQEGIPAWDADVEHDGAEHDDVEQLLELLLLADRFDIFELSEHCCERLVANLALWCAPAVLALAHKMAQGPWQGRLLMEAIAYVARHFEEVAVESQEHFCALPRDCLEAVLRHAALQVSSPEALLQALWLWLKCHQAAQEGRSLVQTSDKEEDEHAAETNGITETCDKSATADSRVTMADDDHVVTRRGDQELEGMLFQDKLDWALLEEVLLQVQFLLLSADELRGLSMHPLTAACPNVRAVIQRLLGASSAPTIGAPQRADRDLQLHADQRSTVTRGKAAYLVPRAAGGLRCRVERRQFMYAHDGDCNGVLYHIGTSCGKTAFRNPAVMKQIVITASSPTSRFTNPMRLSSRTFVESSSALPRHEQGRQSSWWRVDFGEQRRIMCDYYTVRHDGSQDFARNWSLQGSEDEENWVDLRQHQNDRTITSRGQFASFPVTGHGALLPFRWLQVVSVHKSNEGDADHREQCPKLCIGALEFYGVLQLLNC